jgi:hypothetical protein
MDHPKETAPPTFPYTNGTAPPEETAAFQAPPTVDEPPPEPPPEPPGDPHRATFNRAVYEELNGIYRSLEGIEIKARTNTLLIAAMAGVLVLFAALELRKALQK